MKLKKTSLLLLTAALILNIASCKKADSEKGDGTETGDKTAIDTEQTSDGSSDAIDGEDSEKSGEEEIPEAPNPFAEETLAEFFENAAFVGDSVMYGLDLYSARNQTLESASTFLTITSFAARHALSEVSENSYHPSYNGEKMKVEDALVLDGANKVFIFLGLNDVRVTPNSYYENYIEFIDRIKDKNPEITIFIMSTTYPVKSPHSMDTETAASYRDQLADLNTRLSAYCDENDAYYVDVVTPLLSEEGFLSDNYSSDDYVHLTNAAYAIWVQTLENYAQSLIDTGKPPEPGALLLPDGDTSSNQNPSSELQAVQTITASDPPAGADAPASEANFVPPPFNVVLNDYVPENGSALFAGQTVESFFEDAAFVGDSVMYGFQLYTTRNKTTESAATFLTVTSFAARHALSEVSEDSYHPSYNGVKMKVEDALALDGAGKVLISLGLNDVLAAPNTYFNDYTTFIGKIKEKNPDIAVFLLSATYPVQTPGSMDQETAVYYRDSLAALNVKLSAYAAENGLFFIDVVTPLLNDAGFLSDNHSSDNYVHLTNAAYKVWQQKLESFVTALLEQAQAQAQAPEEPLPPADGSEGEAIPGDEETADDPAAGGAEPPVLPEDPTEEPPAVPDQPAADEEPSGDAVPESGDGDAGSADESLDDAESDIPTDLPVEKADDVPVDEASDVPVDEPADEPSDAGIS